MTAKYWQKGEVLDYKASARRSKKRRSGEPGNQDRRGR